MDIKKRFATDVKKETEGVWVDIGDGMRLKIARLGNKNYTSRFQELLRPYRAQARAGTLAQDLAEKLYNDALAETILVGWEGIELDGETLTYSRENALRLIQELPDFKTTVTEIANTMEAYREADIAAGIKNSERLSSGT